MTPKQCKRRREALGMTQKQLGEATGYAKSSICKFENGTRRIKRRFVIAIGKLK